MIGIYVNEVGKSRPIEADSEYQSQLRKEWFSNFEKRLRESAPDLMDGVQLKIVGSVARGLASAASDVDITVHSKSSDELLVPKVRKAVFDLLDEMRDSGETTYRIEIQEVGNPLMFSAVANFRRQK